MAWKELLQQEYAEKLHIEWQVPLAKLTTFKIGGPAECMITAESASDVETVIQFAKEHQVPLHILGNGSNLLVDDEGVTGIVLYIGRAMAGVTVNGNEIIAEAGARMAQVAKAALDHSLTGLEFSFGIPGTIGGGVIMNAGAYGGELCQVVTKVEAYDQEGNFYVLANEDLNFGYRRSLLKEKGYIVTKVYMECKAGNPAEIKALMSDLSARRIEKQPLEYPSAGSTFKRPEGHFVGKLIEDTNLKGVSVGGAKVSEKHGGFIINEKEATCKDVKGLIEHIQKTILAKYNIELEPEYVFWNKDTDN